MHNTVSKSRKYVAICVGRSGNHYLREFMLPEGRTNDSETAAWFFLNRLDPESYVAGVITHEDYLNIVVVPQNEKGEYDGPR